MKLAKCKNPKTYNLTKDKNYSVDKETEDLYYITNDRGFSTKYLKDLFEAIVEEPSLPTAPPPPPPVLRTEQDCINSIVVENNVISHVNLNGNPQVISTELEAEGTSISCGIGQIFGLNAFMEEIDDNVDTSQDDMLLLKKALFKTGIRSLLGSNNTGMSLLSTNIQEDSDLDHYYDSLDELVAEKGGQVIPMLNPNSGNNIKLWVIFR